MNFIKKILRRRKWQKAIKQLGTLVLLLEKKHKSNEEIYFPSLQSIMEAWTCMMIWAGRKEFEEIKPPIWVGYEEDGGVVLRWSMDYNIYVKVSGDGYNIEYVNNKELINGTKEKTERISGTTEEIGRLLLR